MSEEMKKLLPKEDSHKGQNGKVLIIGGSELFHAASKWSLDVASRFVDMVFYASTPENNEIIKENKGKFWEGIVIAQAQIGDYIEEADVVLMGPGMTRDEETKKFVNKMLETYPEKKWVLDAGALQVMEMGLVPRRAILTPHEGEMKLMERKIEPQTLFSPTLANKRAQASTKKMSAVNNFSPIILLKGRIDKIIQNGEVKAEIAGGNAGMTKGGTGDCLAGLVAAVWTRIDDGVEAAKIASTICKAAGDELYREVGPFYNASDLAAAIPKTAWRLASSA